MHRILTPRGSLLAAGLLVAAGGCQQATKAVGEAANGAALATAQSYRTAIDGARLALEQSREIAGLLPWIEPPQPGPQRMREAILARAGRDKFASARLAEGRSRIEEARIEFPRLRDRARVERFEELRARFRGGSDVPQRGSLRELAGVPLIIHLNGKPVLLRRPTGTDIGRALTSPLLSRLYPTSDTKR